jgi:hypothetical protein
MTTTPTIAARAAAALALAYQALLLLLIALRPDLDPSWHTISEWALGPYGWVMTAAFLVSAASYGALLVAVRREVRGHLGMIGLALLLVCTIGTFGVGLFTTDPLDHPVAITAHGTLHTLFGSSALLLLPFAALAINLSLARNEHWVEARRLLHVTAFIPLIGLLGFVVYTAVFVVPMGDVHAPGVNIGWPPRFAFAMYAVWIVALVGAYQRCVRADKFRRRRVAL